VETGDREGHVSGALTACAHGSLYRGKHVHVGVRPAAENGAEGLTIQVSTDAMP
jgi:hypothetical protein